MKSICTLLLSLFIVVSYGQYQFKEILSTRNIQNVLVNDSHLYAISYIPARLIEIDKATGDIRAYDFSDEYRVNWAEDAFIIDNYLVVLNVDVNRSIIDGHLVFDLNSKQNWLDSMKFHFTSGSTYWNMASCSDDQFIYTVYSNTDYADKVMLKYRPDQPTDTIDLSSLPINPNDEIHYLAKSDSIFCAYVSDTTFILWNENNIGSYNIIQGHRESADALIAKNGNFYFSGSNSDQSQDSIYYINSNNQIVNFTQSQAIPSSQNINKIDFLGDSIVYNTQYGAMVFDTTDNSLSSMNQGFYNFPYDRFTDFAINNDGSIYLATVTYGHHSSPRHCLFNWNQQGEIDSVRVDTFQFVCHNDSEYNNGWFAKNGDIVCLNMNSLNYYRDGDWTQIPLSDPFLNEALYYGINPSLNSYSSFITHEDKEGFLYGELVFDMYAGYQNQYPDSTVYVRIDSKNYNISYLLKNQYDSVALQQVDFYKGSKYYCEEGHLKMKNSEFSEDYFYVAPYPLERVFISKAGEIYCSGERSVWKFDFETKTLDSIIVIPYQNYYKMSNFTEDQLGNVYFNYSSKSFRIHFHTKEVQALNSLWDDYGINSWVLHDGYGNLYGRNNVHINGSSEWYFIRNLGLGWDFSCDLTTELNWGPPIYFVDPSLHNSDLIQYSAQSVSHVLMDCPIRDLDEVLDVYGIYDTTDQVSINIGNDMDYVLWDDGTEEHHREINYPGTYWVKTISSDGCSQFKRFEVELNPTVNNSSEEIFYYFETNHFPLIFEDDLSGDLRIYDLKGSLVKEFIDYQNDWTPPNSFQGSIMVFGIYDGATLLKSGRIIFI